MKLVKNAYAKINLGLDVIRRREDGYHEVKMVMQTVDLCDTLTFERREDEELHIYTDNKKLPCDRKIRFFSNFYAALFPQTTSQAAVLAGEPVCPGYLLTTPAGNRAVMF